ncbi:kinesin-like protein klp-20 [Tribolium madens]|uniref:kinesin-like protein klp-20 n=1 Tax=Tribolium madens TaxID=41895 RepID=UPI001CF74BEA|nr:kinesin-like protein klp-20 [Tribolium madens]
MTHLKVGVRVRPLSRREFEGNSSTILEVENDGKTVAVTNIKVLEQNAGDSRKRIRRFTFDFCLHENSTQDDVFQAVENVISKAIKRRNHSCVLAYGQSSSGKTHTMMGFPHDPGVTPKLCQKVFDYLQESAVGNEMDKTKVTCSYLEIYNEKVRDLLHKDDTCALRIRQHPKKGPYVQGLSSHPALDSSTLLRLLSTGNSNRRVGATLTNPQSSRSHSVFIIQFDEIKLTLVDLAGSERTGNRCYNASRFREGANINKSLVALGNVISALAEDTAKNSKGIRRRFIPFRDSVLTWLLKDTLGGNSDTVMIATISPSSECYSETVNTLRFGQRAKLIVSIPVVNEDPKEKTIRELRAEIARLRELLSLGQFQKPMSNDNFNTTEKLIPVMSFTDSNKPEPSRLRRTSSIDHPLKKPIVPTRKYGSEEALRKIKPTKNDKGIVSETKPKVEAKVDSIRRTSIKPRSQIVAAVTHRLYAKTKKKEVATDTFDLPTGPPKELSICSNARLQLKELTRRALKAHKFRNEETQTELFPVLRVKETSTDVDDLKSLLYEVRDVETSTEALPMEDKGVSCAFLDSLQNAFIVTRSCGTQAQSQSSVSFTKYLQDPPKMEIFNPHTANPIYTSSVNINISHNYINGRKILESVSDDSLDDQSNVCFPTPDLISNHNSLEPSKETLESKLRHASCNILEQEEGLVFDLVQDNSQSFVANTSTIPMCQERVSYVNIPSINAPQVCYQEETLHRCEVFTPEVPEMAKPNVIHSKCYNDDCITLIEPLVLKSIMKHIPEGSVEPEELPDSLEYHMANSKKVHFNKSGTCRNERMMKAMSDFLEEATILMNNLSKTATHVQEQEREYDVHVSINGLVEQKRRRKRRVFKNVKCQTEEVPTKSNCIQTEDDLELTNKYELLLEDSCRRLEEKIAAATDENIYNPWDFYHHEDTSLESNSVTFSDYGSLPRRTKRHSSCTPSAYLRQLASMRRQVVEASREELSNHSDSVL